MAWETRKGRSFYYRTVPGSAGAARKLYLGRGPGAQQAAAEDRAALEARRADRAAAKALAAETESLDRLMDQLGDGVGGLVEATFLAAGLHQHKSSWRKKRVPRISHTV